MYSKLNKEFNKLNEGMSNDAFPLLNMASKQSKLIGLFVIALMILNFPLLGIFNHTKTIGGIPSVFIFLFVIWLVIIFVIQQNVRKK